MPKEALDSMNQTQSIGVEYISEYQMAHGPQQKYQSEYNTLQKKN